MNTVKSPLAKYRQRINVDQLESDKSQVAAITALDKLYLNLIPHFHDAAPESNQAPASTATISPKGIYLWGPVGRGKSMLMNIFFDSLPVDQRLRLHFHRFMARVHTSLREASGMPEPLDHVADSLANESKILCFDEFYVSDIGDAMILYRLFKALFSRGVTLVATSNISIEDLYKDGLHRGRFQPAIGLLKSHVQQIQLDGQIDYRFNDKIFEVTYFLDGTSNFRNLFQTVAHKPITTEVEALTSIEICGREIQVELVSQDVVWFNFLQVCEGPRSHLDYIELADRFKVIMISNVPAFSGEVTNRIKARGTEDSSIGLSTGSREVLAANHDNAARRFISLVDEFYDRGVVLYVSAEVPLLDLYVNGTLVQEFHRTRSRLMEMQSEKYLKANRSDASQED